jgi:hypothetical protein
MSNAISKAGGPRGFISAAANARAQDAVAAAQAAHKDAAAFVKANLARLQSTITPDVIAATKDPVQVAILQAKLAKAVADAATIDARLNANLTALNSAAAQIQARTRRA